MSQNPRGRMLAPTLVALAALAATAGAHAAENRGQRYSPGVGGSDMTSPLVPGWYGQVALLHYHATKLKGNDGKDVPPLVSGTAAPRAQIVAGVPAPLQGAANASLTAAGYTGLRYNARLSDFRADAYVILPRITYLSTTQVLGANVGFTAMLPLVRRQTSLGHNTVVNSTDVQTLQTGLSSVPVIGANAGAIATSTANTVRSTVDGSVSSVLASREGQATGIGDLEISPIFRWEIGDHQAVALAPTIIVPTGEYNASRAVNAGFGNFYTFRPSIQYAFIGDGWDVGARLILSFNSPNEDTKYRSGNMLNVDFAAMKFVTEDVRAGVQGYVVQQFTKDSSSDPAKQAEIDAVDGNKMRAYALGPAVAWIKDGGEMLLEGKVLQEFGARNRSQGTSFWFMLSKPFGL